MTSTQQELITFTVVLKYMRPEMAGLDFQVKATVLSFYGFIIAPKIQVADNLF